ncbi:MAG TPA: YceI family protein [Alphaproteobacteria bacterium]|nr:YceI family protein [Alphaproteobacteria bacterium]
MRKTTLAMVASAALAWSAANAASYEIDPSHSAIQWKTQHLGYSWMLGRFNQFEGTFEYDPAAGPAAQEVSVVIDTASIDSNHAKRDKHLRSADFLNTDEYPTATFESTKFEGDENGGKLTGDLTFMGVTREVVLDVTKVGEGEDPWGGYRAGFKGTTQFDRRDFGMDRNVGPASWIVRLELHVEGIRQ